MDHIELLRTARYPDVIDLFDEAIKTEEDNL